MSLSPHAVAQALLWGTDAQGWAMYAEPLNEHLFQAVLQAAEVGPGTRVLDVGCGTGGALQLARRAGAEVTGVDVAVPLLALAQDRLPGAEVVLGEADALPFPDGAFDAVLGINAIQFAADPTTALREAARVLAPGGRIVASLFADRDRVESTVIHEALAQIGGQAHAATPHVPYLLSEPGALEAAMAEAGLAVVGSGDVTCVWEYRDVETLVRGSLSSAGGARALSVVPRAEAAAAVKQAAHPFVVPDGRVRMTNVFRWVRAEPTRA